VNIIIHSLGVKCELYGTVSKHCRSMMRPCSHCQYRTTSANVVTSAVTMCPCDLADGGDWSPRSLPHPGQASF